jgi:hypothetical protein
VCIFWHCNVVYVISKHEEKSLGLMRGAEVQNITQDREKEGERSIIILHV